MPGPPNMASLREVIFHLNKNGLKPQRGMGQNFLVDGNTVEKIIASAELEPGDPLVEVGPGAGALTAAAVRRKARVLAVELDQGLARMLQDLMRPFPHVRVLHADALRVDWKALARKYFGEKATVKLLSNLPYNISSPFLYALLKQKFPFIGAVLMFQREVAERVVARPGTAPYGALSVLCRYYTEGKLLFKVSRRVFWPRPGVDSAVVKLSRRLPALDPAEEDLFWRIVQGVFQQRRKTVTNGLLRIFPWARENVTAILRQAALDPSSRPEKLGVTEFANLSRIIYNLSRNPE